MTKIGMSDVDVTLWPMDKAEAEGYAAFNDNDHICIEVPDGQTTVSLRTSEGKRLTVALMPYRDGGAPQCADVQFHDSEARVPGNDGPQEHPAQNLVAFALGKTVFDSRRLPEADRPMFTTILFM